MAKTRLTLGGHLLLRLLVLVSLAVSSPLLTPSADDVSDLENDRTYTPLLPPSNLKFGKRSDFDEQSYSERGGLASSSSSSSEEDNEEYRGTGIHVGMNRAKQEDDGEEGKILANWEACVNRGNAFMKLFGETEVPKAEQSKYFAFSDLRKHGWTLKEKTLDPTIEDKCLIEPLDKLKVPHGSSPDAKLWQRLAFEHDQETTGPLGEVYPVSHCPTTE